MKAKIVDEQELRRLKRAYTMSRRAFTRVEAQETRLDTRIERTLNKVHAKIAKGGDIEPLLTQLRRDGRALQVVKKILKPALREENRTYLAYLRACEKYGAQQNKDKNHS